jgi:hypothetical protein
MKPFNRDKNPTRLWFFKASVAKDRAAAGPGEACGTAKRLAKFTPPEKQMGGQSGFTQVQGVGALDSVTKLAPVSFWHIFVSHYCPILEISSQMA